MIDALDRLAGVGEDLFRRVGDIVGRGGMPLGGEALELVRRVGGMPVDVLEYALRLDVEGLRNAAGELRGVGSRFGGLPGKLEADVARSAWEGGGAEAFGIVWDALAEHIGSAGEAQTIVGKVASTVAYIDSVAGWAEGFRRELAEAIARVVCSAEAVAVVTAGDAVDVELVGAATRIVERVLRAAAEALDEGAALVRRYEGMLVELAYHPPVVPRGGVAISGVTRVNL
ncbi:hypothetical protein [Dactylosporangium sp. CA-233914]|uniref:hypothetical protein n=1 Tax=Dactylosporangium sp. CA-233914 TaxID=3239934 RepID=UPI003D8EB6B4